MEWCAVHRISYSRVDRPDDPVCPLCERNKKEEKKMGDLEPKPAFDVPLPEWAKYLVLGVTVVALVVIGYFLFRGFHLP